MPYDACAGNEEPFRPPAGMSGAPGPLLRLVRDRRVAFLIVGAINTAVPTTIFALLLFLTHGAISYLVLLVCAHVVAVLSAFVLYRRFVFRVSGHVLRDLARFEVVNLSVLGFNVAILPVLVEMLGWPILASQLVFASMTVVYSWFAHKGFSFRRSPVDLGRAQQQQA